MKRYKSKNKIKKSDPAITPSVYPWVHNMDEVPEYDVAQDFALMNHFCDQSPKNQNIIIYSCLMRLFKRIAELENDSKLKRRR